MTAEAHQEAGYFSIRSTRGRFLLLATVLASGMAFLAASMVAIALPTIQAAFDAQLSEIQWVMNAPLTKSALAVPERFSGLASGINNAISRLAALLAVAVLGAVMLPLFSSHFTSEVKASSLTPAEQTALLAEEEKLGGASAPDTFSGAKQMEARRIIQESFVGGFQVIMWVNSALAFLAGMVGFLFIRHRGSEGREHIQFPH